MTKKSSNILANVIRRSGKTHLTQDEIIKDMTLDEIKKWRDEAAGLATNSGRHASSHNKYRNQAIESIRNGERLTSKDLEKLVSQSRKKAGIGVSELLEFTLGKTARNEKIIETLDATVLNTYLANVKKAASQFTGGITPQQVINLSRATDIKRANEQIFLASLFKREGNVFYFLTNAGPNSKAQNHKVVVQLLNYPDLLLGTTKAPPIKRVSDILKDGKIKFDCDCGRHRYWYRYIATVGKYNFGIDENRYPSTRNPDLTGLGCKHVLRVMNHVMSGMMVQKVRSEAIKDIAKAANNSTPHIKRREQVEREARRQVEAMNNWNGRLHWAKEVRRISEKAEQAIEMENERERKNSPGRASANDIRAYNFFKKSLKQPFLDADTKALFKEKIKAHESKWGAS